MKELLTACFLLTIGFAMTAFAQAPPADLAQKSIDAYNNHDVAYFEKILAADVVWMDEDGHMISGKDRVLGFVRRQLTAPMPPKITAANIKMGNSSDAAWVTFAYTIDRGGVTKKGLNTTVFKKVGNDWQIVVLHGAMNAAAHM